LKNRWLNHEKKINVRRIPHIHTWFLLAAICLATEPCARQPPPPGLAELRKSQKTQPFLRLFRHIRKHHRNMIAGMPITTAGNHDAIAMDAATILR